MSKVALPDALDAIERNVRAFLVMAGEKPGYITVQVDTVTGTASISHTRNIYNNSIDCTIYLPAMRAQSFLTKDELDRWIGYFIHELCHALYTDEAAWKVAVSERIQNLVNGLEDVRIERKFNQSAIAANSFELLNSLLAFVVGEIPASYSPNDVANLSWTLAMIGRVELCGYDLPEAARHMAKLSPAMRALASGVMVDLDRAQNTLDVVEIVRKLQAKMKPGNKPEETESGETGETGNGGEDTDKGGGENDGGETGETGNGGETGETGNGGETGETDGGETGETRQPEAGRGNGGEAVEGEAGNIRGKGGEKGAPEGEKIEGDLTACKPVDLTPVDAKQKADAQALARSNEMASEATLIEAIRRGQRNAGKKPTTMKEAARNSCDWRAESMRAAKLRAQVARVLKAEESESWDRGRAAGRLDRFALARVGAGQVENVFAKRTISGGYETEIDILVDASGSMSGAPMRAASVLSYVVAQAAQQVGVKCQISVFTSDYHAPRVVKLANESLAAKSVEKRFSTMSYGTDGSTPLTEAIVSTAARLASRAPAKRKMIFVVSDGGCDNGPQAVKKACEYADRLGVETVALCIDVAPHNGFRFAARCNSGNIAEAGLGVLVKALSREM